MALKPDAHSNFDNVFALMREGNHAPGTWGLFYEQQARAIERFLKPGQIVLDIGCGPELPYAKKGAFIVGVDASFGSVEANKGVDLQVFASAAELPIATGVADAIVCFYSVHHMTGMTVQENRAIVAQVFREFARVLKPEGRMFIFDMSPWMPFAGAEALTWNTARQKLGGGLDMFFWKDRDLQRIAKAAMPDANCRIERFGGSYLNTFPPVFSKPGLRVPRFLYPFDINLYIWERGPQTA